MTDVGRSCASPEDAETGATPGVVGTLVDSNVLLDILTEDETWVEWSARALEEAADQGPLVVNPLVYAEISVRFTRVEDLERELGDDFVREPLPWEAAFLAGKAFLSYRKQGGAKASPLPDFYIGAHAAVRGLQLLSRDARRFRTYYPSVKLISPN
jgi:predicted nucleic acid-binding protein